MSAIIFTLFGTTNVVEFDATLSEKHDSGARATEHPVEEGANTTDHVRPELDVVSLEGIITNTPLNDASARFLDDSGRLVSRVAPLFGAPGPITLQGGTSQQTAAGSLRGGFVSPVIIPFYGRPAAQPTFVPGARRQVQNNVSGTSMHFSPPTDRVKEVYSVLQFLCTSGVEVKLVTDLREYPTMLITQLSSPRAPMDAMIFSMSLRQVRYAETDVAQVKLTKKVAEKRAEKTVTQGAKPLVYVLEPHQSQYESWATRFSGSANSQRNDFGE